MEVYFIDVNDTGRNIIHEFGCPNSKPSDREFLGLFENLKNAIKGALNRFPRVVVCTGCCIDDHESGPVSASYYNHEDAPATAFFHPMRGLRH